jgi:serine/threonine protein kinase/Flp pilus assembly protein TadD
MSDMVGQTISHYRLQQRLGAGAMGEVYLAEDLRLGRQVALKFLPREMTRDGQAKARFVREARAASILDHPNVCTVYDIEETPEGQLLLAMGYCDGESLRSRMDHGPMPVAEAIEFACQMADGLAEAHARGVVHRDVKPANAIITTSGRLKIVDFGLARVADATAAALTEAGTTMGTPQYMAPEQLRGEEVDGRADIWSLGVVLYEMLTGQSPFLADALVAIFYNILNVDPESVDRLRPEIPAGVAAVVQRALRRDAGERYQHASDMAADLRACQAGREVEAWQRSASQALPDGAARSRIGSDSARTPSIAVLPFMNLSADKDQEYFCDGMAEELINALGTIDGLRVTSFTSSLRFKGQALDIRQIGQQLRVQSVVEGSVRKAGNRVRLSAQLINVSDGFHVWSDRFDRELDDVFEVQDEIAKAIVGKLKVKLLGEADAPIVKQATGNLEAYHLYLQGRYHYAQRYKGSVDKAAEYFEQAVQLDSGFAAAYAGLADCYAIMGLYGYRPAADLIATARAVLERSRELDDSLAEVHHAIGTVKLYLEWDWPGIERAYARALEINPGLAYTRGCFAIASSAMGDVARVEAEAEKATSLDPLSPLVFAIAANAHAGVRQYDRAEKLLRRALELQPDFAPALLGLAQCLPGLERYGEAVDAAARAVEVTGRHPHYLSVLGCALAKAGRPAEATVVLEEIRECERRGYVSPIEANTVLAALVDIPQALAALERAAAEKLPPYPFYFVLPAYDSLRGLPRFRKILDTFNYAGTWLNEPVQT